MYGYGRCLLTREFGQGDHIVVGASRNGIQGVFRVQRYGIRFIIGGPHVDECGFRYLIPVRILYGCIGEEGPCNPRTHAHEKNHAGTAQGQNPHGQLVIPAHSPLFPEEVEARSGQSHIGHRQCHIQAHLWKIFDISCIYQPLD